jgi:hypothetical protein
MKKNAKKKAKAKVAKVTPIRSRQARTCQTVPVASINPLLYAATVASINPQVCTVPPDPLESEFNDYSAGPKRLPEVGFPWWSLCAGVAVVAVALVCWFW